MAVLTNSTLTVLADDSTAANFEAALGAHHRGPLLREETRTLQINVGKLCNQACHHCHVDAGPKRTEIMARETAERTMALLARSPTVELVDITGGAPELNHNFRWLVSEARRQRRHVIDRSNLTVLFKPGMEDLPEFIGTHQAVPRSGMDIAVGSQEACAEERPSAFRVTTTQLHWVTSGATSFVRGLNDTPKIVALVLVTAALSVGTPIGKTWAFAVVALGMVAGSWVAGQKVTKVLAEKVTPMDHQEGFIANLVTAGLVGPGAALGLPMSTTHVSSGAIIGVGVPKKAELNWKTVQSMALTWILTIPLAAVLGVSAFIILRWVYAN